jgi:NAD(P)-dependent dehydrogenase (short-subunit alcohol dehydrogenase family)
MTTRRSPAALFALDGEVAIVTGGVGRLGVEYGATLSAAGASVALFDIAAAGAGATALAESHAAVTIHRVDTTDRTAVDRAVADVVARFGTPTILVNNAGLGSSPADAALETARFECYPASAWRAMLDSHLTSALVASQAFLAAFRASKTSAGSIINISSTYGVVAPDQSMYESNRNGDREWFKPVGYSVAKSGMLNFTRWLAEYCGHERIPVRVNTLVPGGVRESDHAAEFVGEYERRTMLGRMADVDDYNGAILFLASRASAYMTGATLVVDGGWTAR